MHEYDEILTRIQRIVHATPEDLARVQARAAELQQTTWLSHTQALACILARLQGGATLSFALAHATTPIEVLI